MFNTVKSRRRKEAKLRKEESTTERLLATEKVNKARLNLKDRSL